MSTAPTDISLVAEPGSGRNETLPRKAWIYFVVVTVATAAATLPFLGRLQHTHEWAGFLVLGSFAAGPQLFTPRPPPPPAPPPPRPSHSPAPPVPSAPHLPLVGT